MLQYDTLFALGMCDLVTIYVPLTDATRCKSDHQRVVAGSRDKACDMLQHGKWSALLVIGLLGSLPVGV